MLPTVVTKIVISPKYLLLDFRAFLGVLCAFARDRAFSRAKTPRSQRACCAEMSSAQNFKYLWLDFGFWIRLIPDFSLPQNPKLSYHLVRSRLFPPGRARLTTIPWSTGSPAKDAATMISTLRPTSSSARTRYRSGFPSSQRSSRMMFWPLHIAEVAEPLTERLKGRARERRSDGFAALLPNGQKLE